MLGLTGCPHCGQDSTIERIQSSDELNWTVNQGDGLKELWQCQNCAEYFILEYKVCKITLLTKQLAKL